LGLAYFGHKVLHFVPRYISGLYWIFFLPVSFLALTSEGNSAPVNIFYYLNCMTWIAWSFCCSYKVAGIAHFTALWFWLFSLSWNVCAASMSGSKLEVMKEFESSSEQDNTIMATQMKQIKNWLLSHLQYMNFFTILVLASVTFSLSFYNETLES